EKQNNKTIQKLNMNHINWQGYTPPFQLIHQKTLIIDSKKVIVMTFNFTHSSFNNERNFGLIIDDPKNVSEIESTFFSDWSHQQHHNRLSSNLFWSPENSRDQ